MKTVWGDLLFFVNFCMDFQCLFLTARLLCRPFHVWRSVLFSAFGAAYAVAALFIEVNGVAAFLLDLAVCFLMCVGSFYEKKERTVRVFLPFLIYFGVSFAVGGVMSGMASLLARMDLPIAQGTGDVSPTLFLFLALLGGVLTFLWGRFCHRQGKQMRAHLLVGVDKRSVRLSAMVDSGNLLSDPVSARPVVILSHAVLDRLFDAELSALLKKGDVSAMTTLPPRSARRVRILRAATVTGGGLMPAVLPDFAYLCTARGETAVEVLLAAAALRMGTNDCEALLPAEFAREI